MTSAHAANRLQHATSPYLQQHAHNPVDWYEWGPEALARARRDDKPIFLSVGYSACHWCHVMAHESFADPAVAALLNELFVNIKVDREERPDLDEIYMQATLALNQGQGGWPMSVWLTPELKPFFAGTYYPPTARWGHPGFAELCQSIGRAWRQHRTDITAQADKLTQIVCASLQPQGASAGGELSLALVDETAEQLAAAFDTVSGGIVSGGANKFPPSMALDLLLRSAARRAPGAARRQQFIELVELTLDHMAFGGLHDQLAGGFHRYSTDVEWHVPHFEKMLYDQALVSRAYCDAWRLLRKPLYERAARQTCEYVLSDLTAPDGGFYSARDADSEGVEGKYYVWTRDEVLAIVGPEDGALFCAHYDITDRGNWSDPHDPATPKNVLRELRDARCCGKLYNLNAEECAARLGRARARLLAARSTRVPPALDDKILAEWNGLMIASLAHCGAVFDEPRFVAAARRAAERLLDRQRADGRLRRVARGAQRSGAAFLSDYGAVLDGLLELYFATFERRWFDAAVELQRVADDGFWDAERGGYFFTAADHEALLVRSKDLRDAATPSGNSLQYVNLLRLAALTGDPHYRARAAQVQQAFAAEVGAQPWSAERFLAGVDFALGGSVEIALVGAADDPALQALLRAVRTTYLPNAVLAHRDPHQPHAAIPSPLLAERGALHGRATAYVCRAGACAAPVAEPAALASLLASLT